MTTQRIKHNEFKILIMGGTETEYHTLAQRISASNKISSTLTYQPSYNLDKVNNPTSFDILIINTVQDLKEIKAIKNNDIPIPYIVISTTYSLEESLDVLRYGAEDYITPDELTTSRLERSILYAYERHRMKVSEQQIGEELFSSVLNSLSAHIAVIDHNAVIIKHNKAWKQFADNNECDDLPEKLREGDNYVELLKTTTQAYNGSLPYVLEGVKNVLDRKSDEFHIEYPVNVGEQECWHFLQVTPLQNAAGGAVISHTDITQRVKLEKLKDEFLSIASHELKTPLTTIKGYIQLLEKYAATKGNDKIVRYVTLADLYVDKLNHLISSVLDMSRIQSGRLILRPEALELTPIVKDVVETMQHLSSRHTISLEGDESLTVFADRERIEQVLMNIISNAIKFSPNADSIEVKIKANKTVATISITDHGIGIAKYDQDQLFQRFSRLKNQTIHSSGLGIGLYLSAEIVKRQGGEIWVESNEGKGSTFYFTVPLHT